MVNYGYARKGSENRGSGICGTIIHHNHGYPEPEAFLHDSTHPCPMVISGNDNGKPKRYIHEIRDPETTVSTPCRVSQIIN
jgi:hypothetical protein